MRLDGRTALVTGGTQGVGSAIAQRLAKAGCNVILHGLKDDQYAQETTTKCEGCGVSVGRVFVDLTRPASEAVAELQQRADEIDPKVSLLVNNAGTFCDLPFLEMDWLTYQRTMRLNVDIPYFLSQAYAKRWVQEKIEGRILFTGSINGQLAEPCHTAYDTSKGAVRMMVRSLCVALAPYNIRVNAMAPGLVVTPLTAAALDDRTLRWMRLHTPNGTVPGPEVCADSALFLLSDEASHIHGQTLLVDGGMSVWQQPDAPDKF